VQFRVSSETGHDESCLVLNISRKLQDVLLQDVFLDREKKHCCFIGTAMCFFFDMFCLSVATEHHGDYGRMSS